MSEPKRLSDLTTGRDNNLNLLRFVAAFAVLVSHGFVIVTGTEESAPLSSTIGMTWGSIAVDVFFVTSGFLVTASLMTRRNTLDFIVSRALRIYPALITMVMVTIALLGIFVTKLSFYDFLGNSATWTYVFKNMTLWFGVTGYLPEVFTSVPFANKVNASLWTLPFEVRMYGILAIVWLLGYTLGRFRQNIFSLVIISFALLAYLVHLRDFFQFSATDHFHRLFFMFFSGSAFYVARNRIYFSHIFVSIVTMLLLLSTVQKEIFFVTYNSLLAYIVLWIAYVPSGNIRKFNKLGDYSYGTYIYAFPVQQSVVMFHPGISVWMLICVSSAYTILFAFLSWHLIEKRALSYKKPLVR